MGHESENRSPSGGWGVDGRPHDAFTILDSCADLAAGCPGVDVRPHDTFTILDSCADLAVLTWQVALESIRVRGGRVDTWIAGESAPRQFEGTDATMRLGPDYHSLDIDMAAAVHERDASTYR